MKGTMTIKVSKHGIAIDTDLDDISLQDKLEFMHSVSVSLGMTKHEMFMYLLAEQTGALTDAESVVSYVTAEEAESLLRGGGSNEG